MSTSSFTTFDRRVFALAVVVYLCAAWFSTGFHAADEHYQVIAFAEAKLGNQPIDQMPWEYDARIRSAFLPTLCLAVFKGASGFGLNDPFGWSFLLRLLTALFALWSIRRFVRALRHKVPPALWRPFLLLSFFLWFLPFLGVRFAGETWSGLFVLLALAELLSPKPSTTRYLQSGLLLGLAFLCRPPTLALAAGIVLWLVVVKREHFKGVLQLLAGIVLMIVAGVALDSWFYGEATFTAWNYLQLGIGGHEDHPFTPFAWWYYPAWIVKYGIPPIGLAILASFATLLVLRPKDILVWTIIPFLVLHFALAHKDLRFLYPVAFLIPLLLIKAWNVWVQRKVAKTTPSKALKLILGLVAVIDLVALLVVIFSPAGSGRTRLASVIQHRYPGKEIHLNYVADKTTVWDILIPRFYLPPTYSEALLTEPCLPLLHTDDAMEMLITDQPLPRCNQSTDHQWHPVEYALPRWKEWALKAYELEDVRPVWILYESGPGRATGLPLPP